MLYEAKLPLVLGILSLKMGKKGLWSWFPGFVLVLCASLAVCMALPAIVACTISFFHPDYLSFSIATTSFPVLTMFVLSFVCHACMTGSGGAVFLGLWWALLSLGTARIGSVGSPISLLLWRLTPPLWSPTPTALASRSGPLACMLLGWRNVRHSS